MTPKQILDSFSETLMRDERILSAPERALVATLLHHAKASSSANPETQEAVRAVIASAIGETVAQRAFAVLGGSIVERILEGSKFSQDDSGVVRGGEIHTGPHPPFEPQPPNDLQGTAVEIQNPNAPLRMKTEPDPPSGQPHPGPGVRAPHKEPQPPSRPMGEPDPPSGNPHPPGPGVRAPRTEPDPPSAARTTVMSQSGEVKRMDQVAERRIALLTK